MSILEAVLITLAALGAGTINTLVGSGSLITFPTLLIFGYPPLVANISNNVGLVPGGASGAWGYRHELHGARAMLLRLVPMAVLGSVVGAMLLLTLPQSAFDAIVPVLVIVGIVLVVAGPRISAAVASHPHGPMSPARERVMQGGVFGAGIYGGYFGAAQGVILMGLLSSLSNEPLQRLNGYKNVLATVANLVAALVFLVFALEHVRWSVVGLIAVGSSLGGLLGAKVGRRLPPAVLRGVIVVVGVVAVIKLIWFD